MADAYDPESDPQVQKYKYLLGLQPKPPDINAIMPAPALPGHVDIGTPQIKDALDRYDKASLINGITSTRTPNWYQVQHGGTTHQAPSPTFDAVKEATLRPVQSAMGMMEHQNAIADTLNKYNEAKGKVAGQMAGSQNRMGAAEFAAMTGAGARTDAANTNADARRDVADTAAGARVKAAKIASGDGSGEIAPGIYDREADRYNTTGSIQTPKGLRGPMARKFVTEVMNRADAKASGTTVKPLAQAAGDSSADMASLKNISKLTDAQKMFEGTARGNLLTLQDALSKIKDSGSPFLNKPIRQWSNLVEGSPEMAAFNAARQIVNPEVAKVLSGAIGSGSLTDTSQKHIDTVLSENSTVPQMNSAIGVILRDFENRSKSADSSKKEISGRLAPPAAGGKTWVKNQTNSKTGAKRGVYSDGSYGDPQ